MRQDAGRFAPSPTGPLHSGSLLAATASYLDARQRGARWLLRIDDLDVHRNAPGADTEILHTLEAHGLFWDGQVIRQSERTDHYDAALARLADQGDTFYCTCSRRQLKSLGPYPGTCRDANRPPGDAAIRLRVTAAPVVFDDLIAGLVRESLADTVGDFIVRRRDGLVAYQLATAVDDGDETITRVVRGGDLLDNTARQIYLMKHLGLTPPAYGHVPTLVNEAGQKLSKQTFAPPLDNGQATANLLAILPALGIAAPAEAAAETPESLLRWAASRFSLNAIRSVARTYRH